MRIILIVMILSAGAATADVSGSGEGSSPFGACINPLKGLRPCEVNPH